MTLLALPCRNERRAEFIERLGEVGYGMGLPRTMSRLLGWLVVCDPPHQTAQQGQTVLQLSAGSVSTGFGELTRAGLVERLHFPGERRTYYRIRPDGWGQLLAAQVRMFAEILLIANQAVAAASDEVDDRLREAQSFYARCEGAFTELLAQPSSSWPDP